MPFGGWFDTYMEILFKTIMVLTGVALVWIVILTIGYTIDSNNPESQQRKHMRNLESMAATSGGKLEQYVKGYETYYIQSGNVMIPQTSAIKGWQIRYPDGRVWREEE